MSSEQRNSVNSTENTGLNSDARALQKALSELVRIYQFRDRRCICYHDVSVTQCYAISALVMHKSLTLNKLAEELYLDKSTASRVVNSLERKGYVHRFVDPQDGRALRLEVTADGRELYARIEQDIVEEMKSLITDFDPEVRSATIHLIARLARAATMRFSKNETRIKE